MESAVLVQRVQRGADLDKQGFEGDSDILQWARVICGQCGRSWYDTWELVGMVEPVNAEGKEIIDG